MDNSLAIDKYYDFEAFDDSGCTTDVTIHVRFDHDETMRYGVYFLGIDGCDNRNGEEEVKPGSLKDLLDDAFARDVAQGLYDEWKLESVESEEDEAKDKTIGDFIDPAYEYIGTYYLGYYWSLKFKEDCIEYFIAHH